MPGTILYFTYLAVMAAGLGCFLQAFRQRRNTPVHRRWGLAGVCVSLGGIAVVLLGAELAGWSVDQRWPEVVAVHRKTALAAMALLVLTAATGMLRARIHRHLYRLFLPLYAAALLTAALGYRP